jgi:hypothetical protein
MAPNRKTHSKKHRKTGKWIVAASIILLIAVIFAVAYSWQPANAPANSLPATTQEPEGLKTLANHYMTIMHSLNSSQTKTQMQSRINQNYNQTQLYVWEQSKLTFQQDPSGWFEDPIQILDSGKGICVQYSVVYVSACLARGYQSRLVVAVDTSSWSFIHTWAEDYYNGSWVHVDPSDGVWNNPMYYHNPSWETVWGKDVGSSVRIYAFMDGSFEDVTSVYSSH